MATAPISAEAVRAIRDRRPFTENWLMGYITPGGTYLVATPAFYTDNGRPTDLMAILPGSLEPLGLGGPGRVVPLWISVNPDTVAYLERELAG